MRMKACMCEEEYGLLYITQRGVRGKDCSFPGDKHQPRGKPRSCWFL